MGAAAADGPGLSLVIAGRRRLDADDDDDVDDDDDDDADGGGCDGGLRWQPRLASIGLDWPRLALLAPRIGVDSLRPETYSRNS